jgi:photosystem II stability/assembly factor-like uncharacterized protein
MIRTASALLFLANVLCAAEFEWKPARLPDGVTGNLFSVHFVDPKTGFIAGEKGLCLVTHDAGAAWTRVETGSAATLRCVRFKDAQNGFICGDGDAAAPKPRGHVVFGRPMTSGTLLSTTDGGKTWKSSWLPTNFDVWCVETTAAPLLQIGISGGSAHLDGDIARSHDAGANWKSYRCYRALFDIRSIEKNWIAVGSRVCVGFMPTPTEPTYTNKAVRILFSKDGGEKWDVAKGSDGKGKDILRGLAMKKGASAIAVGDSGCILLSADGGESWTAAQSGTAERLTGVAFFGANSAVAVGAKGTVVISADDGKTWKAAATGSENLNCVSAAGEVLFAAGEKGTLLRAEAK